MQRRQQTSSAIRLVVAAMLIAGVTAATGGQPSSLRYVASGTGSSATEEQAMKIALQIALADVLDQNEQSVHKGRDSQWTRRLMLAHPRYVVQGEFDVMTRTSPARNALRSEWTIEVRVRLPVESLNRARTEAEVFLSDLGRPTIALIFSDRVEDRRRPSWFVESDSDVAQQLAERLRGEQFEVRVHSHAEILRDRRLQKARIDDADLAALQQIATQDTADIFIHGLGRVMGPDSNGRIVGGRTQYVWKADAKCRAYWTDDASLIDSFDWNASGFDSGPDHGRVIALQRAGESLAGPILDRIFAQWSIRAFEGRPVTIEIRPCDLAEAVQIEDELVSAFGRESVLGTKSASGVTTIQIMSKRPPIGIYRAIAALRFSDFRLVGKEANSNTLRFQVRH